MRDVDDLDRRIQEFELELPKLMIRDFVEMKKLKTNFSNLQGLITPRQTIPVYNKQHIQPDLDEDSLLAFFDFIDKNKSNIDLMDKGQLRDCRERLEELMQSASRMIEYFQFHLLKLFQIVEQMCFVIRPSIESMLTTLSTQATCWLISASVFLLGTSWRICMKRFATIRRTSAVSCVKSETILVDRRENFVITQSYWTRSGLQNLIELRRWSDLHARNAPSNSCILLCWLQMLVKWL